MNLYSKIAEFLEVKDGEVFEIYAKGDPTSHHLKVYINFQGMFREHANGSYRRANSNIVHEFLKGNYDVKKLD